MSNYPLAAFHFTVEWGGTRIGFTEVSGLDIFFEPIQYREGNSPVYSSQKMPGIVKFNNIILKMGIHAGDNDFFKWMNTIKLNTVERRDITIKLLNEDHEPILTWAISNAFPVRYSGPVLNANSNKAAMEELEIAHEGLHIIE